MQEVDDVADTIIEALYNYFGDCPLLANRILRVDFLGEETDAEYTIDSMPCTPTIKRYVDGSEKRQYLFTLGSRAFYNEDVLNALSNSGVFENIAAWLKKQSSAAALPKLPSGCEAQSIEALSTVYILESDAAIAAARYQIQCKLIYLQEV